MAGLEAESHFKHPEEQFETATGVSRNLSGETNFSKFRAKKGNEIVGEKRRQERRRS